jgi:hypothetical protein
MISAVNALGPLRFLLLEGRVTAGVLVEFLGQLLHGMDRMAPLIVDGHRAHIARSVGRFVEARAERIELFLLPPYSPGLKPDGLASAHVKSRLVGALSRTTDEPKTMVRRVLRRRQRLPEIASSFFHAATCAYSERKTPQTTVIVKPTTRGILHNARPLIWCVLAAAAPADCRCGIDGLALRVRQMLATDPLSGAVFVFRNRRGTAVKLLLYDGQGFWLCQKRLSRGRFRSWPQGQPGRALAAPEPAVLLFGRVARRLSADWQAAYGHPACYLETFVDPERFRGPCHAGEHLARILDQRQGPAPPIQMSDALARNQPGLHPTQPASCIPHGRRKFVEVARPFPEEVVFVLTALRKVFQIERRARQHGLSPEARLHLHQTESATPMEQLKHRARRQRARGGPLQP